MVRYIIAGNQRSGTSAVHNALKDHPECSALNDEIGIDPFFTQGFSVFTHGNESYWEKEKGLIRLFDCLTSVKATEQTKALGLKTVIKDADRANQFVESVKKNLPGIKIILTYRNDFVAQYASLKRAQSTGKWHSWQKHKTKDIMITINQETYEKYLLNCLSALDVVQQLKQTHDFLIFDYEMDLMNQNFRKLFDFVGVSNLPVEWMYAEKVSPMPEKYIIDYTKFKEKTDYYINNRGCLEENVNRLQKQANNIFKKALKQIRSCVS
jgi:hypothetical protein